MDETCISRVNEIDKMVATNLLLLREKIVLSQYDLSNTLGVSIQQIQKYEEAIDRIPSGNLYKLSNILNVPLSYFFMEIDNTSYSHDVYNSCSENSDNLKLKVIIRQYRKIQDNKIKKQLLNLISIFNCDYDTNVTTLK